MIRLAKPDIRRAVDDMAADTESLVSRDLLASLIDSLPDAVVLFAPDGRIVFANTAFRRLSRLERIGEGTPWMADLLDPETAAAFDTACATLTPVAPRASFEAAVIGPGGEPAFVLWNLQAVFDGAGRLLEYQASGHDVTDERRYQAALERMIAAVNDVGTPLEASIIEVLEIGREYCRLDAAVMGYYDPDGRFQIAHSVGRSDLREPGCPLVCSDLFAAAASSVGGPVAFADVDRSGLRHSPCRRQSGIACMVGQRLDVGDDVHAAVLFYGTVPRAAFHPKELTLVRLLTQWLSFAIERHEQIQALSAGQAELTLILETMPAYIAYKDREGRLLTANAAARGAAWPEEARRVDAEALATGHPIIGRVERWEDEELGPRWMRTDRIPFTAIGGARLLVVATDVTELAEKEHLLAKANSGLTQFTYIASHDLQEPLRKIGTFTDLLTDGLAKGDADDVAYSVRVIKDSARRASALIQDLLSWSRLTNRAVERAPIPFAAIVRDTMAEVLSLRRDMTVNVFDMMSDITIRADAAQVRQLAENLLTNAVKYRSPARPTEIQLRFGRLPTGNLLFEMEDNGIGFDPIYADVIFEPFRRLHNDRQYAGSGIGLAICSKVCEHHGWKISAEGRPGEGAVFRVEMPVKTVR